MRSIWKGAVSFGLVSIGVKLYSATEEKGISFHQVHREDAGRIRYQRVCSVCGKEVAYADIAKGYQLDNGEMVVLTDEDLADLPLTTSRAIEVLTFVPLEQVDPIYFNKSYYLEPEKNAAKPYVLLREALEDSDRVAIVKVALRQRESLATLRVRDDVLVLETMIWPDEVRRADFGFLDEDVSVRPQELEMARSLIESMTGDFEPEQYTDEYREALERVIEAKISGHEVVEAPDEEAKAPTGVVDLMAALRASVDRAKAARGEGGGAGEPARQAAKPVPAKQGTAKRGPAKAGAKQGAKKAGAKKTGATKAEPAATSATSGSARTARKAAAKKATGKAAQSSGRSAAKRTANSRRSA